ncbi:hypothetical protein V6N12_063748 [Hibiscus sabdariffa]|uniref:RNase H type-1 domain-containing protein n=1 Tax=Hibiscus sabdariffa TaxID=183260 RepID=A0ABR2APL7_9ROSI
MLPARVVSEYAQMVCSDFQGSNVEATLRVQCARQVRWTKLALGHVKVNVDGAWSPLHRVATIGVIARDHHGMVLDGCAKKARWGTQFRNSRGLCFWGGVHMSLENGWEFVDI